MAAGGTCCSIILYFVVWRLMLLALLPGDVVWSVESGDQAIKKVSATNMGIFSLISFAIYKLFGKKNTEKKEIAEEKSAETEVDELINSIE